MIKFIIGLIIFGLIALAIIILIVINFTYKGVRQMRKAAQDQWELNQKRKEHKEKNPFGDDYFKSAEGPQTSWKTNRTNQTRHAQQSEKATTRKATTSGGVTIIDEREAGKKIFSHDDGEYVEFEEVN